MYKLSQTRIMIIIGICLLGIFFSIPNLMPEKAASLPSWWQPVNLGLDLQGGSNLLLEVKIDDVLKEKMDSIEDGIRQTLRENKIRYQSLKAMPANVQVKIENLNARNKAASLFRKLDKDYDVKEEADGLLVISYNEMALNELKSKVVDQSIEIVRRRIDELGTKEPVIQRQGADRIVVQLPGLQNPEYVKTLLGKTAKLSFHLVDSRSSALDARRGMISNSSKLVKGSEGETYVLGRKAIVTGEHLVDAQASFQDQEPVVSFKFDTFGGKKFGEVTKNNIGERLAIVLDNEVISAPTIQSAILGGSGIISGSFTAKSANDLALLLRSGALPAPLEVLEERTVGAGLGADSIRAGAVACVIGLIAVVAFIIAAYGLFGIFTTVAVFTNLFLMLGILSFIGATLTLPGIAGIILTIGMAVDANVLIFERMREEVKAGRSPRDAADAGFTEAWTTIVDSNLTTLVAAIVLFWFGTGPVRGFAVTLAIGIATSMFTSVTVTRVIIATWLNKAKPTKLPIM
ncbi:MAG: protein translocase subunit SecD [Alphaproteobacteria bacterium]|nr:protein translocase subunit SecD [Alphaproteobacteria bacterium]MBQ8631559.1 protein translocase subunit SecD [Alphaproteobacteria bacterium]